MPLIVYVNTLSPCRFSGNFASKISVFTLILLFVIKMCCFVLFLVVK